MPQSTWSVLLVDDDPHTCNIFQLAMEHHNIPLTIMNTAEQALDYMEHHKPEVVILDLFLPDIDGYQALKRIKARVESPTCRFVATTAYYTNDTRQDVMQYGFDGYLPKPFDTEKLVAYLRSMVDE